MHPTPWCSNEVSYLLEMGDQTHLADQFFHWECQEMLGTEDVVQMLRSCGRTE